MSELRLLTVGEFQEMSRAGMFRPDERVELWEGELYNLPHTTESEAKVTLRLNRLLKRAVKKIPNPFILYRHTAVAFNEYLKTVPDVSLLHPLAERNCLALYTKMDAALLLEVTEQDTDFTRAHKLPLYARAGIPEAWLVNIPGRRVELHAEPVSGVYQIVRAYQRGETVQAHTLPELSLTVDEILG